MTAPSDNSGLAQQFYLARHGALAWSGSPEALAHAHQALAALSEAAGDGLDASRYRVFQQGDDAMANDISLTKAVLSYMQDLAVGRQELRTIDSDVALPARSLNFPALLDKALHQDRLPSMFRDIAPHHDGYTALKASLARGEGDADIIAANMERWRWLPATLEPDRIMVNAADAQLEMWLGGKLVLTSKVVVGRPANPTPILRAEGAGITVHPPWNVPHSIAAREILPKLKRSPAWLARNDMVLLNGPSGDPQGLHVNWRAIPAGTFPYQIRQYPGPRNPLGQIKLELPNRFDVYLHDTPAKADFRKPVRQLSHGCVRVEQILPLATYALGADTAAMQRISDALAQDDTSYLPLEKRLPVYFLYWTAFTDAKGSVQYRSDVYGRDRRLIAAMRTKPLQIAATYPSCARG